MVVVQEVQRWALDCLPLGHYGDRPCAACGRPDFLYTEPDGTRVCAECYEGRNGDEPPSITARRLRARGEIA